VDSSRISPSSFPLGGTPLERGPHANAAGRGGMPHISGAALAAAARQAHPSATPAMRADVANPAYTAAIQRAGWHDVFSASARQAYVALLKSMPRWPGRPDPAERSHLLNIDQSLLHRLAPAEFMSGYFSNPLLIGCLQRLDKVSLSPLIREAIGHRPEAIVFSLPDYRTVIPALEDMLTRSAVYLKGNNSFCAERVLRFARADAGGYTVTDAAGAVAVLDRLDQCFLPAAYVPNMNVFIAEAEIPIARTESGATWELRMLPPHPPEWSYAKLGKTGSIVNNVAQGGSTTSAADVVRSVVRARFAQADDAEVERRAAIFLQRAYELAGQVKDLTDEVHLGIARAAVLSEDMREPDAYEDIMRHCFSGNFLCIDITGAWDQDGELVPMVIEAQTSAHLPERLASEAYETCLETMNGKRACLQNALR
jgi:hypothetical protein